MSYQALSIQDDDSLSPNAAPFDGHNSKGSGPAGLSATSTKRLHQSTDVPSYLQAINYIHISDVGDIIGTVYHIDTDKPPAYGRFDSQEEQDEAPNVYLSAKTIAAEIRLSGSKKAKIEIKGCTTNSYGRTMLRIVDAARPLSDGTPGPPTHFTVNVSATCHATALVAVPASFSGSITGACSLTGHIRDEAVCLVADAKKSRWTIRQEGDTYASGSTSEQSSHYPPPSAVAAESDPAKSKPEAEETETTAMSGPEHSLVSFTLLDMPGPGDALGKKQRARRHVVYDSDYGLGIQRLEGVETAERALVKKALIYYFLACAGWTLFIYSSCTYFEGPMEAFVALTIMPLAVSLIFPLIVIGESWTVYHYKPPLIGSV